MRRMWSRREVFALPLLARPAAAQNRKLKVLVVGGHPDDPESGCGGTMARYAGGRHSVVAVYLTRGERGIEGRSPEESARIRTKEAEAACRILGARPVFAGQIDGGTEVGPERYGEFRSIFAAEAPDLLFAHWPIDTHRDHRAASMLAYDAWLSTGRKAEFYYFAVMTGEQTQDFAPTHYVDISAVVEKKKAACFAHVSQSPGEWWDHHRRMDEFYGLEAQVKAAEGFVRHPSSPGSGLLPK